MPPKKCAQKVGREVPVPQKSVFRKLVYGAFVPFSGSSDACRKVTEKESE